MTSSPRRLGKFEILERLGEGAMGEVFLARDTILGREVALKTIHPSAMAAPDAHERFIREAQAAGRLNHPNLVTIHEFGEDQGVHYMAMEHLPGQDLAALFRSGEVDRRGILELLAQVCDGLAYAHQRGVLHRDIKPSNVRVTRFGSRLNAKVLDFGIARITGSELTSTGTLLGTFAYLAPECVQGGKPDHRADIFAVGVMLYEALAGERPFGGDSTATVLHHIVNEEPAPLDGEVLAGISPHVRRILARSLAKSPAARYATADAMAADLRAARDPEWKGGDTREISVRTSRPLMRPVPVGAPPRKGRLALVLLALLVVAGAVAAGAWAWRRHLRSVKARLAAQAAATPPPAPIQQPPVQPPPQAEPPQEQPWQAAPSQAAPMQAAPSQAAPSQAAPRPAAPQVEAPKPQAAPPAAGARYRSLDEAAAAMDADPKGTLAFLEERVKEQPNNEQAIALRIAALYAAGDYRGSGIAMMQARQSGHALWPMALKVPQLRKVFEQERQTPRLPRRRQPGEQP